LLLILSMVINIKTNKQCYWRALHNVLKIESICENSNTHLFGCKWTFNYYLKSWQKFWPMKQPVDVAKPFLSPIWERPSHNAEAAYLETLSGWLPNMDCIIPLQPTNGAQRYHPKWKRGLLHIFALHLFALVWSVFCDQLKSH